MIRRSRIPIPGRRSVKRVRIKAAGRENLAPGRQIDYIDMIIGKPKRERVAPAEVLNRAWREPSRASRGPARYRSGSGPGARTESFLHRFRAPAADPRRFGPTPHAGSLR